MLIIVIAAFLVWAVSHINFLLLAGDWDFFIDWKDRQYWVLIMPISTIITAAAFQSIFWNLFRLPIGATASMMLLLISVWIVRYHGWHTWAGFPLSLVVPASCVMGAIVMDTILVITRSWVLTGVFGGVLFSVLFFPATGLIWRLISFLWSTWVRWLQSPILLVIHSRVRRRPNIFASLNVETSGPSRIRQAGYQLPSAVFSAYLSIGFLDSRCCGLQH